MTRRKLFDIPSSPTQSTAGARRAYFAIWNREWPHDDDYLRELAREVPSASALRPEKTTRCELLLTLMRENHEFEPDAP